MTFEPKKKLRIIVLMHEDLVPPDSLDGLSDKEKIEIKTEYDVVSTLNKMGPELSPVGLYNQLNVIGNALMEHKPPVAFNLLEEFHGYPLYDQHVVSYLELMKQAYTGCNPRGLTMAHDKALTKIILSYHRIQVPGFAVFPLNRKVHRPKRLKFPLLVKSISEEGSVGIAQASIVYDDDKLAQRVDFIHRQNKTAAIAEQSDGRFSGSRSRERITTSESSRVKLGTAEMGVGISAAKTFARISPASAPANKRVPARASHNTTPAAKMSLRRSTSRPFSCSGDM